MPARDRRSPRVRVSAFRSHAACSPAAALAMLLAAVLLPRAVRADLPYEQEPIDYLKASVDDPIARLQQRLDAGDAKLNYDDQRGYLPAVLEQLGISTTSQTLVFSKTSFQRQRIARTPRALYFNDDTYIGYVQHGEVVEISTTDIRGRAPCSTPCLSSASTNRSFCGKRM